MHIDQLTGTSNVPNWIVIDDPRGEYPEGGVVTRNVAHSLAERGAAVAPCAPDLFRLSGVGGFHKRAWGPGWPMPSVVPAYVAPMTIFLVSQFDAKTQAGMTGLNWRALLLPTVAGAKRLERGDRLQGFVRFAPDGAQPNPNRVGLKLDEDSFNFADLGAQREGGGWLVGGSALVSVPQDGHYGFALYGFGDGVRVAWSAVTQSARA